MLGKLIICALIQLLVNNLFSNRLIERVHLVTAVKTTRLKTGQYKFHILLLCPYIIIFVLMVKLLMMHLYVIITDYDLLLVEF